MNEAIKLSVVVAVQYAEENMSDILRALAPERHPDVEFIFCYTETDTQVPERISGVENALAVMSPVGSLIPHLWRDGIRMAKGGAVAITTAHVVPADNWVDILLETDLELYPGVGGVIGNDPVSGYKDWAIYFLRYIALSPPKNEQLVEEIAADNALYRRDDLLMHPDLLDLGFWEPSFHARFRKNGQHLLLKPRLMVIHHNRYSSGQFFLQRYAHGRAFGLARAVQLSHMRCWFLILLSPLLPFLFLGKIISAVFKQGTCTRYLAGAFPWLLLFLSGWGLGEARGYLDSLRGAGNSGAV